MDKLKINMLSKADSVDGQGVGSAYLEQVALVKEADDLFEVAVNKRGKKFDIYHIHSVNPGYYF
ncbi:MAG: glycosyltransferase, partial [bacterium]|nr:glycosyltransferase [bacterium]